MGFDFAVFRPNGRRAVLVAGAAVSGFALALPVLATTQTGPFIVSVTTSPNPYAIEGTTTSSNSVGILGYGTGAKDVALEGYATQPDSTGLEGFSDSSSGTIGDGVFGYSANGVGVYGDASGASDPGVFGINSASSGIGVEGKGGQEGLSGSSPAGIGVDGQSTSGIGVVGVTDANSSAAESLAGVEGFDSSSSKNQIGVYGQSTGGVGLQGFTAGGPTAVLGTSVGEGSFGYGLEGSDVTSQQQHPVIPTSIGASFAGVYGTSKHNFGVYGETDSDSPTTPLTYAGVYGVDGTDDSNEVGQLGVYGYSTYGVGVLGASYSPSQPGIEADQEAGGDVMRGFSNAVEVMSLDTAGNMILKGNLTMNGEPTSTVRDPAGVARVTYGAQQTEATLEDFGSGEMRGGIARVALDPAFACLLDPAANYMVIVTPGGPNAGVYVTAKSLEGFEVRETSGRATMTFDYRIVGRPRLTRALPRLAAFTGLSARGIRRAVPGAVPHHHEPPLLRGSVPARFAQARHASPPLPVMERPTSAR